MGWLSKIFLGRLNEEFYAFETTHEFMNWNDFNLGSMDRNLVGKLYESFSKRVYPKIDLRIKNISENQRNNLESIKNDITGDKFLKIFSFYKITNEHRWSSNYAFVNYKKSSRYFVRPIQVRTLINGLPGSINYWDRESNIIAIGNWNVNYGGSVLPNNATPPWTLMGLPIIPVAGYWEIINATDEFGITINTFHWLADGNNPVMTEGQFYRSGLGLNNSYGTMVEFRAKFTRADMNVAFELDIEDGTRKVNILVGVTQVRMMCGTRTRTFGIDAGDRFHIYRILLKGTTAKLYIDDLLIYTETVDSTTANNQITCQTGPNGMDNSEGYINYVKYLIGTSLLNPDIEPMIDMDNQTLTLKQNLPAINTEIVIDYYYEGWKVAFEPDGLQFQASTQTPLTYDANLRLVGI